MDETSVILEHSPTQVFAYSGDGAFDWFEFYVEHCAQLLHLIIGEFHASIMTLVSRSVKP